MISAFIMASIIPILILQYIGNQINKNNMMEKVDLLMVNDLTQNADQVNLNLEIYTNLLYQMYVDEQITENILVLMEENESRKAIAYNRINNRLKQYYSTEPGIRCISVVCSDGSSVVYDFSTGSSVDNLWRDFNDLRKTPPYLDAVDKPGMVITPTMKFNDRGEDRYFFHISKRMFDFRNLERGSIATITMTVDQEVLNRICNTPKEKEENTQKNSINFIVDNQGIIITYPEKMFAGTRVQNGENIVDFVAHSGLLKNKNIAVNTYEDPITGWIFYNAYDKDYMLRDIVKAQTGFVLIGAAAILFATVLIIYTVKQMNRSLSLVVRGMKEVQEGSLDVVVPVVNQDEIGEIAKNFNSMTEKVKALIAEVKGATNRQKNAEIKALEAQINPHFLYNTIDSINWMAIEKEEYEISQMLCNLGVILRYSVNKSNQLVSIWEMADWIEKYVSLHQMRFDNAFACMVQVEPEAENKKIYKLLLQPFIENSILHGFKDMEGGGILRVEICLSEDKKGVDIIIEDNGRGMDAKKVSLFNDREKVIHDSGESIGLYNAFSRIYMYYGDRAYWNVSSIDGMGTVITLKFPCMEDTEDESADSRG